MSSRMAFALALAGAAAAAPLQRIKASATTPYMYDEAGRVRVFHGLNGVTKEAPWYPQWWANETFVAEMAGRGVNAVRLGWMWSGFQPSAGADGFNMTYYEEEKKIVDLLAKHGIHTFLDVHQDCFSSRWCMYDGFPLWLANRVPPPKQAYPFPFKNATCSSRGWMTNCLTEAVTVAYQALFDNHDGMKDAMVAFWARSAAVWKNNPNILAYELVNEPFAGDIYADPELLLPGVAGRKNLQPLYHDLAAAIRAEDNDTCIMYEPVTWGMLFDQKVVGSGFTEVPGGASYADRSILSYHYYCKSFGGVEAVCKDVTTPAVFHAVRKDVEELGGSNFLTEFGGCDSAEAIGSCQDIMDTADSKFASWTHYDGLGQSGQFPPDKDQYLAALTRPYARAIAGTPKSSSYNSRGSWFRIAHKYSFCYEPSAALFNSTAAPTEVYIPFATLYTRGAASVELTSGDASMSVDTASQIVTLVAHSAGQVCISATV